MSLHYPTQDITDSSTSNCMDITANDVTLDCQGNTIDGDDFADYGIKVSSNNVSIQNCSVLNWDTANVYLLNSNYTTLNNINITKTTITLTLNDGLYVSNSHNLIINNSLIQNHPDYGIHFYQSSDNSTIENTNITNNAGWDIGIEAIDTSNCNITLTNVYGTNNKSILWINTPNTLINDWDNNISEIIVCGANDVSVKNFGNQKLINLFLLHYNYHRKFLIHHTYHYKSLYSIIHSLFSYDNVSYLFLVFVAF